MFGRSISIVAIVAGLACPPGAAAAGPKSFHDRQQRIDAAIRKGADYLLSQITEDGTVKGEYPANFRRPLRGGQTAIVAYALLSAGVSPQEPKLRSALNWLMEADLKATYTVSLRACALAAMNDPKVMPLLRKDVQWLINAAGADGAYSYTPRTGATGGTSDNSNTQFALLGVWAASQRGVSVPRQYWQLMDDYWAGAQQSDGGWNYRSYDKRQSYGSMTAAGLASLFVTQDALHRGDELSRQAQRREEHIDKGLKWLEENFSVDVNPGKGTQWWYYWLYSLERVALASGFKYFGNHDWYRLGSEKLLAKQSEEGYWHGTNTQHQTAFALLFLSRGRWPVLVNKLKYRGRWNARPRDMANLTRWLGSTFERPVSWQVVDIDGPAGEWHDAPILYISGAGACEFSDQQIQKLRNYVLQGGLILAEAAGNSGDFTLDMHEYYRRMLPEFSIRRLSEDDPIYNSHFAAKAIRGLEVISNGIRPLVIHSPSQLSSALQAGYREKDAVNRAAFELSANIYLQTTDKGILKPRGDTYWPEALEFTPTATVAITPVKHAADWNPEPLALRRLAIEMGNRHSIRLHVNEPVELAQLDAQANPVAVMTGTGKLALTAAETEALREYFREGGTMIIDSAGGSRQFDRAVYDQIVPLVPDGVAGLIPESHAVFRRPELIEHPRYRRDLAMALGPAKKKHRLRGVWSGERLAIIYSREDLTAGLVGYQLAGLRGYAPESALALMTNIVTYAAGAGGRLATMPAGDATATTQTND